MSKPSRLRRFFSNWEPLLWGAGTGLYLALVLVLATLEPSEVPWVDPAVIALAPEACDGIRAAGWEVTRTANGCVVRSRCRVGWRFVTLKKGRAQLKIPHAWVYSVLESR